jgi:hypothetical protein
MLNQLKELTVTKQRFGVGFSVAEAWDYMQIKVTYILGVNVTSDFLFIR